MEFLDAAYLGLKATSTLELVSVVFGVLYILLAARQNVWCWPAGFISTGCSAYLFFDVKLLMEAALNVYYLAIAFYGWYQWQYGSETKTELSVRSFSLKEHLVVICLVSVLAVISGFILDTKTDAAFPYLDSATTWAAVIATWMLAKKVLENWLYWVVIDAVSIYLYLQKNLELYALLFLVYIVIAIFAYRQWHHSWNNKQALNLVDDQTA